MSRPLVVAVIIPIATVVIVMFMMFSAVTGFRRGREQGKCANDRHHQKCERMCFHTPLNARSGEIFKMFSHCGTLREYPANWIGAKRPFRDALN
jgi:hypothetical protein